MTFLHDFGIFSFVLLQNEIENILVRSMEVSGLISWATGDPCSVRRVNPRLMDAESN